MKVKILQRVATLITRVTMLSAAGYVLMMLATYYARP